MEEVERWIANGQPKFRVSTLLSLHRKAMDGIDPYAGNFRPAGVAIRGSGHQPISGDDVPRYVEEMLDYIDENWPSRTATHLSSYAMWRLNWIHPFADGNGRTSRMMSYMLLCGRLGYVLPGSRTIPEQISENKKPYFDALEAADAAYKRGSIDVSKMETLLENYLANQLVDIHGRATGNDHMAATDGPETQRTGILAAIEKRPVLYGGAITTVLAVIGWLLA